jgi:hypothetical protein
LPRSASSGSTLGRIVTGTIASICDAVALPSRQRRNAAAMTASATSGTVARASAPARSTGPSEAGWVHVTAFTPLGASPSTAAFDRMPARSLVSAPASRVTEPIETPSTPNRFTQSDRRRLDRFDPFGPGDGPAGSSAQCPSTCIRAGPSARA